MAETTINTAGAREVIAAERRAKGSDLAAHGEPFVWAMGGSLVFGLMMIVGFLALILFFGFTTFWPKPIAIVTTEQGRTIAGEVFRSETFRPTETQLEGATAAAKAIVVENKGYAPRTLYRVGNYDIYNEDFVWVPSYFLKDVSVPKDFFFVERREWGPFIGRIKSIDLAGQAVASPGMADLNKALAAAGERRKAIQHLKVVKITSINHELDHLRLKVRRVVIEHGETSPQADRARAKAEARSKELNVKFAEYTAQVTALQADDGKYTITLEEIGGQTKTQLLSSIVRLYAANNLTLNDKIGIYAARWGEFVSAEPREANTEGGILPAIVGTFTMMVLLSLAVAPFGVITALYLREYAKQGPIVSFVRICVNNLAGVPSIVYGVFGLGFFCYILGGSIDQIFFPERLPSPTFGTGGLLWAALTLALLTVPVVIVATEEALAAVPRTTREGSLACGASKWQTIKWIVLPRAAPGIMTGLILAMARAAGEVAPLMLVGVVKSAPALPIDGEFPFLHLDRKFMHLAFAIFDSGFQSPNVEAARPMVFVTTLLLLTIVICLSAVAIVLRNQMRKRYSTGAF